MSLIFLIPLAIAGTAAYTAYESQEEIVTLFAAIVTILSLVLSFVLAPWVVQILILVSSLVGIRYFCYRHACKHSIPGKLK